MMMTEPSEQTQSPAIDPQQFLANLKAVVEADNLAGEIDDVTLTKLGQDVIRHYDIDLASMSDWIERMDRAIDLAALVKDVKTYPWDGAANIRYPLITSAALQYNARAYPAIVPSTDIVKIAVHGKDENGQKANRAKRIATFMSWQLKVDSREWERGTDQLTLQLPIIGDVFRKLWYDPVSDKVRSQIRLPGRHIVINNNAGSMQTAPRVSDTIDIYPHVVESYMRAGRFVEIDLPQTDEDTQKPETFIEQLGRHDLDGDGYPEPYIITVHKDTQKVVRVVSAYDMDTIRLAVIEPKILSVEHTPYLVHYQFMPSMDGGFFGTGMGLLLGDISETVNSTINMIMDAGHMSSLGAGYIAGQNFRVKGGVTRLRPGEWKHINAQGDDIRRGMVELNFPGPSPVLFQMLGMMIQAGREIASVNDVMTGDAGRQNMPVGTVLALIEQGQMVFTASYKRIYRAMMDEFELIAKINAKHLTPEKYNMMLDEEGDPQQDFNLADMDIMPVADPKSVTSMQAMGRAQFLLELAQTGMIDKGEAIKRVLGAAGIDGIDQLAPKPDPIQMAMMQAQQEMVMLDIKMKEAELDDTVAATMQKLASAQKTMTEAQMAPLKHRLDEFRAMKEMLNVRREQLGRMAREPGNRIRAEGIVQGGGGEQGVAAGNPMGNGAM